MITPILDEILLDSIWNAIVMFSKKTEWKALGMDRLREQGAALLFYGKPGTGKTITAQYIARKLRHVLHEMDFADIGSDEPGELARNVKKLFTQAKVHDSRGNASLVFLDECDTMLVDRSRLGHNSLWMLEPINALLRAIGEYPGLVILATNQKPDFLDFALERRLLGSFEFGVPAQATRLRLWDSKWPSKLPVQPGKQDLAILSEYVMTGAEIEKAIIWWVSDVLLKESEFKIESLITILDNKFVMDVDTVSNLKIV